MEALWRPLSERAPRRAQVMAVLEHKTRKQVAVTIVRSVLKSGTVISRVDQVDVLFEFISLLIKDDPAASADADVDDEDWDEEQNLVARLVHHLACPETDGQYRMLVAVRKHFGQGGPRRLPHTLPPLVFSGLQLMRQLQAQSDVEGIDVALKKLFQFLYQTVQALAEVPKAESALRLYLQCAQAASACNLEQVAYEFCERAFELFEESIPETKAQIVALQLIVGSLHRCTVFGSENRETLVHKATSYSSKLLKKPDQCRAVGLCSHLFHHETNQALCDPTSLVACLKRSLKNANAAQASCAAPASELAPFSLPLPRALPLPSPRHLSSSLTRALAPPRPELRPQQAAAARSEPGSGSLALFIDILNLYLYFFDKGVDAIDSASIQVRRRPVLHLAV